MAYSIIIPNGILSMYETDFNCPECQHHYEEKDYYAQLCKSKHGIVYKTCKGCKHKIGITTDIKGDVRVWMKKDEAPLAHKE